MENRASQHAWAPWVVGFVALVVAGWKCWTPGLWGDEIITLTMADRSWSSMFSVLTRIDAVHGVYYSVMHVWMDLVGYTPLTLRLPSVISVAATAVVLVKLGALLWNLTAGVVAGFVFVAIPRTLWMATEARSYAFAVLMITLAVYFLVLGVKGGLRRHWIAYGLTMTLAMWVFIYNFLVLPVLVVFALMQHLTTRQFHRFLFASAAAITASVPLILVAMNQRDQISAATKTTLGGALSAPYYAFFDRAGIVLAAVWVVFSGGCGLMLALTAIRRGKSASAPLAPWGQLALLAGWVIVPMGALLAAGAFIPLYSPRYLAISVPALALLAGGGVAATGCKKWQAAIVIAALVVLAYQPWAFFRQPNSKRDFLDVVAIVETRSQPGDSVLFVDGGGLGHPPVEPRVSECLRRPERPDIGQALRTQPRSADVHS